MVGQNMGQKIGISKVNFNSLKNVKRKLLINNFSKVILFKNTNNLYYFYQKNDYNYKYYWIKVPLNLSFSQFIFLIQKVKKINNLKVSRFFKSMLFFKKTDLFFIFKKSFLKIRNLFQRKGKAKLSLNTLFSSLIINKKYFKLDNFFYFYLITHLFKTPLCIVSKKKGSKVLTIPRVFNLKNLLKTSILIFYKSTFKDSIYKTFLSKLTYEVSLLISKDYEDSQINKHYTNLFEDFIHNRSWLNFK